MGTAEIVEDFDLPKVAGRHRNRPLASQRRSAALSLVCNGMTYQQVADHLGYSNRGTVHRLVQKALQATEVASVQDSRDEALGRYEALLRAVWEQAQAGDLAAVRAALRIVQAECRLLALEGTLEARADVDASWPCCQGPATVVTRPDDCRWTGCATHGSF